MNIKDLGDIKSSTVRDKTHWRIRTLDTLREVDCSRFGSHWGRDSGG